ncbi:TadE/TadG family type IV pilus assembly protein [Modestobacter versicolor]|uniref:Flp pilus assembly protein TadG n=1 Tax=Modestobacter versicolor TaxID=429133 RepID=A0A839XX07_9ACTN|nr:TadE/TadG family type IV pilus assembly protein [Modestobacter versicolor]MBB3676190.1 Flp pilus assembly protein TadG [Modestobacter versicolor]
MSGTPVRRRHRLARRLLGERGAAAVEFALVTPVLLLLLFGIVEYSQAMSAQATLSSAAREAARTMALTNDVGQARAAAQNADGALNLTAGAIQVTPATCTGASSTQMVTVTIQFQQNFTSGLVGRANVNLTGRAAMRCGG